MARGRASVPTWARICASVSASVARSVALPIVLAVSTVRCVSWIGGAAAAVIVRADGYRGSHQCNGHDNRRSLILPLHHADAFDWVDTATRELGGKLLRKREIRIRYESSTER